MRSVWRRLTGVWTRLTGDLALFALLQVPLLLLNVLLAKLLATRHAFPDAPAGVFLGLLFRSLTYDLGTLAIVALACLLSRRLRLPGKLRGAALLLIFAGFWALGALYYVDAGVFIFFGGPLSRDLLLMARPLLAHSPKLVSPDEPLLQLLVLSALWPALLTPILWSAGEKLVHDERRFVRSAWALVACLALAGGASGLLPTERYRERTLRRIAPITLLLPRGAASEAQPAELTAEHRRVLDGLLGGSRSQGVGAFAGLARRKRNVVIWVWESVGERYLRSHNALGNAVSPQLDRLEAKGSVRFSSTYVECPLSSQSDFTLMSGSSPPANPHLFQSALPIVQRAPYLPAVFKAAGYHTAFLNSSYLSMWGETRFLHDAGLDLLEDAANMANRANYRSQLWSIEGRAIVDRFFDWRDGLPAGDSFFAVLWNVETHHKYGWIGMPREYEADDDLTRYHRAIEYTDRLLGSFYDGLVARGLDRDTLIVVVGDHGQGLGRGESPHDRFIAMLINEDDVHVPLVFLHPDLARPTTVVDTPGTLADVYPTLLDLAGLEVSRGIDGASLARDYQPRVIVSRAITWWPLSARAGRFKLVQDYPEDPPELYDVEADPWEAHDISGRHDGITQALWAHLGAATARRSREDASFSLFSSKDWLRF